MKIFQAYYHDSHTKELIPNLIHLDTRKFNCSTLEYDIFKHLRSNGDFGVISWKFKKKTHLENWEEQTREFLKTWDAVIINPFPGVEAVSYNCWQSHPSLIPYVYNEIDCLIFMEKMAFCSYIFAKKTWWDKYFDFIEFKLKSLNLNRLAGYSRNPNLSMKPFVIERLLNYCTEGAYMWEYPKEHYVKKFGDDKLFELKQYKSMQNVWEEKVKAFDFWKIVNLDS